MARGKYQAKPKLIIPIVYILLILLIVGAVGGGVVAYLSTATDPITNRFTFAEQPSSAIVNENNNITVEDPGYGVYLRAAVVANWENTTDASIWAAEPVEGVDYTLTLGNGWKKIDGFYYYTQMIQDDTTTPPVVVCTEKTHLDGFAITVKVMAQTIQARGATDGAAPKDAVYDAWGVTTQQITGS